MVGEKGWGYGWPGKTGEGWVVSALLMLTTRRQCWPQAAWLCWRMLAGREGKTGGPIS